MAHGYFVWHDLMAPDVEGAKSFYRALLGWDYIQDEAGASTYWRIHDTHGETGGMMTLAGPGSEGIPPHWLPYVSVPDVSATVARAKALGGGVKYQMRIEVGEWALVHDAQGALLNIIHLDTEPPAPSGPPKPGQFCWYSLQTSDAAAGAAFWGELFGWDLHHAELGGGEGQDVFHHGGMPIAGLMQIPPGAPQPPAWSVAIAVSDLQESFAKAKALGATPFMPPTPLGTMGALAVIADSQGAVVTLFEGQSGD